MKAQTAMSVALTPALSPSETGSRSAFGAHVYDYPENAL
jgi:hypothetical protein